MKKYNNLLILILCLFNPSILIADHMFLGSLSSNISNESLNIIFNATADKRVSEGYNLYRSGMINRNQVVKYWDRIYQTIDTKDELDSMISVIADINDSNLCIITEQIQIDKPSKLSDVCY